jgi:hypothetical protein
VPFPVPPCPTDEMFQARARRCRIARLRSRRVLRCGPSPLLAAVIALDCATVDGELLRSARMPKPADKPRNDRAMRGWVRCTTLRGN